MRIPAKRFISFIALALACTAPSAHAADLEAGEQASALCIACHAADGTTLLPEYPSLAGQGAKYLYDQMIQIRAGERDIPLMAGQLDAMSDETIANIAAWYASLTPRQGQALDVDLELGERIYRAGIAEKSVSACTACHGPTGTGNAPAGFPSLKGLSRPYLAQQLTAYREGERTTDERVSGMMRATAHQLTDAEIKAVANYISGLF